jgi:hypothetical protein
LGEILLDASDLALVAASSVNNPSGGWVESPVTPATQRPFDELFLDGADFFAVILTSVSAL